MIPYFPQPVLRVGPFTIHGFGAAAASALVLGQVLVRRHARVHRLDPDQAARIYFYHVLAGLVAGHLASLRGGQFRLAEVVAFWHGQSAWGVGAGLAFVALLLLRHYGRQALPFLDTLALTFPWVWALVRFGCFLAHEHLGARSSSWLAVAFPEGGRFDLGLLECLAALPAGLLVLVSGWRPVPGVLTVLMIVYAAAARLALAAVAGSSTP